MRSERKEFISYIIPSLLAFALSGVYAIVDGFFVGNSIGDIGLSTINMVYPVVTIFQALGTGFGMGGAVAYMIHHSSGQKEKADDDTKGTILLLLISSVIVTAALFALMNPLLTMLGAKGQIFDYGKEYLTVIVAGGIFQVFGTGIVPLIRNHNGARFAMISMIIGFVTNIVLDYLLVWKFEYGLRGAAIATIAGQFVTVVASFIYLIKQGAKLFGIPKTGFMKFVGEAIQIGIAPLGITLSPVISVIFMNRLSLQYGGESAVATYACISYATSIVYLLLQGVGDGAQPLMSREYGKNNREALSGFLRMSYIASEVVAVALMILLFVAREQVAVLFGASPEVAKSVSYALPIFLCGVPFLAFSRVTTSSFYATKKTVFSYVLTFAEPVLLVVIVNILPIILGQKGVWISMVVAQILSSVIASILKRRNIETSFSKSAVNGKAVSEA